MRQEFVRLLAGFVIWSTCLHRFGLCRARRLKRPDRQLHRADGDDVAVANRSGSVDSLIPDKRPILAAQVFDRRPARRDRDQRVTPRDPGGVQIDLHVRVTSEDVLTLVERHSAGHPFDAERHSAATHRPAGLGAVDRFAKRVPKSGHRPNESRIGGIVADGIANLAHQVGEVLLDHECGGPQPLLKLALRYRLRPARRPGCSADSNALGDRDTRWLSRSNSRLSESSTNGPKRTCIVASYPGVS